VVLAHAGAPTQDGSNAPDFVGEIVEETREMSSAVDVVIAGHSHSRLDLRVPNSDGSGDKVVVEALSYGVAYDLVDISVDAHTGEVLAKSGQIPDTEHAGVVADENVAALVERYRERVAPLADRVAGTAATPLTREAGELGRLAADAQRAFAHADLAVVNSGSLRADIDAGPVTHAELFEALAYDNRLMRSELSGGDAKALTAQGTYVAGPRALDPDRTYTVVANEQISPSGRPVGTEVDALAWFLAR
jgi:5'-nucleotidase